MASCLRVVGEGSSSVIWGEEQGALLLHFVQMPALTGSLGLRAVPRRYLATVT